MDILFAKGKESSDYLTKAPVSNPRFSDAKYVSVAKIDAYGVRKNLVSGRVGVATQKQIQRITQII